MLDETGTAEARERALSDFRGSPEGLAVAEKMVDFLLGDIARLEAAEGVRWAKPIPEELIRRVWKMSAEAGLYSFMLPKALGGEGLSLPDVCAVREAAILTGCVLATHVMGDSSGPPRIGHLFKVATEDQSDRFLAPICAGEKAICFALTEPGAGSDASAIRTRAERTNDGWVLKGQKRFITGGDYADLAIVMAVTDPDAGNKGISAFFVDLHAPGVSKNTDYAILSGKAGTADLFFEDVHIGTDDLIGTEGGGFGLGMSRINVNRIIHCSTIMALARYALELALDHAGRRKQFGRSIGQFQAIQHMLADMATDVSAGRAMLYDAATRHERGDDIRVAAAMAKLFAAENGFKVADRAMQVHGGVGTLQGSPIEYIFRKLRMYRITTGTSEIQKNTIAKGLLRQG